MGQKSLLKIKKSILWLDIIIFNPMLMRMNFPMTKEEYIKSRLEDQIQWYSKKSSFYKKLFYIMRTTEIAIAGLIPVLFCWSLTKEWTPFLSAIVAILASLIALFKFQENWISYRTTSESLKHEKYLYLTKITPYDKDNSFDTLVKAVENTISKENSLWKNKISPNKQKED